MIVKPPYHIKSSTMEEANDPIDNLLDQAEAYAQKYLSLTKQDDDVSYSSATLPPLSLSISPDYLTTLSSILEGDIMDVKETEKGKGFYAKRDLKMGERLVVAKPITLVMGCEVEDDDESGASHQGGEVPSEEEDNMKTLNTSEDENNSIKSIDPLSEATGTKRNGLIILHTLHSIIENPSIWTDTISQLFPRSKNEAMALPTWMCSDVSLGLEIETVMNGLFEVMDKATAKDIQVRLPPIVRYNVLSIETSSEMFVYPDAERGGMVNLEATALFGPEVSLFNHSCVPNVSRYCIGDVIFFVTNRPVSKGHELCFSYIEHEFLCESPERRTALLDMDFRDQNTTNEGIQPQRKRQRTDNMTQHQEHSEEEIIPMPLVDIDMQNEIMATPLLERLDVITDMLNPDESLNPRHDDYQSDKFNLRTLHAITLENLGRSKEALEEWKKCIQFCNTNYPPIDEATVSMHIRAALCAHSCNDKEMAGLYASEAVKMHNFLFGGGVVRMRKRYQHEFLLNINRGGKCGGSLEKTKNAADVLWPRCS